MQKFDFSYDKENDDLFLYHPSKKSKGSVEIGNIILDLNKDKEVVGLQFLNASHFFETCTIDTDSKTVAHVIANLTECKIDIVSHNNLIVIKIFLLGGNEELSTVLQMPKITEPSPATART